MSPKLGMFTSADTAENQGMNKISIAAKGLLLASLLVTSSAWAEWVRLGGSGDSTIYVDPASIRRDGDMRKAWDIVDLQTRSKSGAMSFRGMNEYDCKNERRRALAVSAHSGSMASGDTLTSISDIGDWKEIPPNTANAAILKAVCDK
jgi:hypothetical protein